MFSFDFGKSQHEDHTSSEEECEPSERIEVSNIPEVNFVDRNNDITLAKDINLVLLSKENLSLLLQLSHDLSLLKAEESHSDLLPGVYEGGLKIWECTFDLCDYMINERLPFENKCVLDLGCGSGVLGILAKKLGAGHVHFHDYNSGVIKNLTIPNVKLNFSSFVPVEFFSGDWAGFNQNSVYDVILTSETIYNIKNYSKLHKLFKRNLKPNGIIYLAAKSYYFGVGGSVAEFCEYIEKKGDFTIKKVYISEDGVKREILEIKFATKNG